MRAEFRDGPFDGNDVPLVPRHTASLQTIWRQSPATDFTVALNYVSNRYFDNDQSNDFGEKIPSYMTLDLQAGHVYHGLRLAARVNNLLADKHFDYGVRSTFTPGVYNAYPLPERTLLFTVSREFSS
jgi:iron complex outermembrane receptor protein